MLKRSEYYIYASVVLTIAALSAGILLYPQLPVKMASHWNLYGEVDGYITKFWGVLLMPIIASLMIGLYYIIPRIDPLKKNVEKFRPYFHAFILSVIAFLVYLYALTLYWNLGNAFNMVRAITPAFAGLFYLIGVLLTHSRRNWFIGIRTPWTLSSDKVWDKTHKLGGNLFRYAAIISLAGLLFPNYAFWLILAPVLAITFYLLVYSYLEYKKI